MITVLRSNRMAIKLDSAKSYSIRELLYNFADAYRVSTAELTKFNRVRTHKTETFKALKAFIIYPYSVSHQHM